MNGLEKENGEGLRTRGEAHSRSAGQNQTEPREPEATASSFNLGALRSVPFRLAVSVPLSGLPLRGLQQLAPGQVLLSCVPAADDVPVRCGGAVFAWAELDSVDGQMALRLTRLS